MSLLRTVPIVLAFGSLACGKPSLSECNELEEHTGAIESKGRGILIASDGGLLECKTLTRAQYNCLSKAKDLDVAAKCDGVAVSRAKSEEGCPCGCDHSVAMAAELRGGGGEAALDTIQATLEIIAEREDAGYITEAMVEHRLRLLEVRRDLSGSRLGVFAADDRGVLARREPRRWHPTPIVEDGRLRVRTELTAHGEATEIVRGHDKRLRPSFRLGLEIENVTGTTLTLKEPTLDGRVGFPVSRWYRVGGDGRPWDGVVEPGERKSINVIGYLGEPVMPGTELEATVHLDSLVLHASSRARKHWNREE